MELHVVLRHEAQRRVVARTGLVPQYVRAFSHRADLALRSQTISCSWRLWSLAELRDVMLEAGFASVEAYWEGTDEDGEGDGVFRKKKHAENEETWIAYLAAWK